MATIKKSPSQGNLVGMLAAFGRGALETLTDRFGQYDAAVEAVATHEANISKLFDIKTEWFDAGYIQQGVCYNILTGAQSSVTLPLDVSQLIRSVKADPTETRRYAGVRFTVQGKEDICLYLKFAAISPYADSGAVVFEDLQFCYSPTEEGTEDIDVRYKVRTDKSTGNIVLEKAEQSAGTAPQQPMTLLVCGDNGNTTDMIGDTFALTPTKLTNGSVDYFAVGLTGQMVSRLNALFGELNKAQDPHGSDVCLADTNLINMLPTLMLTFYDGSIAYRFDAVESSPGNMAFVFKGEIPDGSGGFATWAAFALVQPGMSQLEFRLIK